MVRRDSILWDTNVAIRLMNQQPVPHRAFDCALRPTLSAVSLGELYFGQRHSTRSAENLRRVEVFCKDFELLDITQSTARYYGKVAAALAEAGKPIPQNDIWIASLALEHSLPLATFDAHFDKVPELKLIRMEIPRR